ncbi:uncharacterized protein LOC125766196 [Anopheles funestus]|uniref:Chemosensory protein n=1 Tax=Anopheles funestus TaxID=62324 RepID=A0A182RNJ5_ANOFN|nr:uncharacterized protein LOC125766196 [Anopheles funestus]
MQKVSNRSSIRWFVGFSLLIIMFQLISFTRTEVTTARTQVSDEALEKALSDKRYLMRQLKCALGEVPCDPVGKRLKSLAPFVLRGACLQCTPVEMTQIKKTLAHLQRNFPSEWNKLVQTYAG